MKPPVIENLTRLFALLPGIGQKQASRFTYWLVDADKDVINGLKNALEEIGAVKRCSSCFKTSGQNVCELCSDASRDGSKIAVIEKDADLETMEKSGAYSGRYHILGGLLSVLDLESRNKLRLKELFGRVQKDAGIKEIVLALSATPEGEFSAHYIEKIFEPLAAKRELKITRLGRGISTGAELEYLNKETLKNALENRR